MKKNPGRSTMGTYVKWALIIIILLFFITFGVQNSRSVTLNYYFDIEGIQLPLYGLVFISILLGIFAGMMVGITDRLAMKKRLRDLERQSRSLKEEIARVKAAEESRFREEESSPVERNPGESSAGTRSGD
jgi:lipopolysaccharide assembly protein A